MHIKSAVFVKVVVGTDDIFESDVPKIVFFGRSNVGKSSVINSLVNQKNLARTSSFPGRTQEINIFLINKSFHFIDLPGYGFAKMPAEKRQWISKMLSWYLFGSDYDYKKIVLIIDAKVGPTKDDLYMLKMLKKDKRDVIVVANKVDKIKKTEYDKQLKKLKDLVGNFEVIPYSAEKKIGVNILQSIILS